MNKREGGLEPAGIALDMGHGGSDGKTGKFGEYYKHYEFAGYRKRLKS